MSPEPQPETNEALLAQDIIELAEDIGAGKYLIVDPDLSVEVDSCTVTLRYQGNQATRGSFTMRKGSTEYTLGASHTEGHEPNVLVLINGQRFYKGTEMVEAAAQFLSGIKQLDELHGLIPHPIVHNESK